MTAHLGGIRHRKSNVISLNKTGGRLYAKRTMSSHLIYLTVALYQALRALFVHYLRPDEKTFNFFREPFCFVRVEIFELLPAVFIAR